MCCGVSLQLQPVIVRRLIAHGPNHGEPHAPPRLLVRYALVCRAGRALRGSRRPKVLRMRRFGATDRRGQSGGRHADDDGQAAAPDEGEFCHPIAGHPGAGVARFGDQAACGLEDGAPKSPCASARGSRACALETRRISQSARIGWAARALGARGSGQALPRMTWRERIARRGTRDEICDLSCVRSARCWRESSMSCDACRDLAWQWQRHPP